MMEIHVHLYNSRLLLRPACDHEDCIRYWLTDATGRFLPVPDKVLIVTRRLKSEVYYRFDSLEY